MKNPEEVNPSNYKVSNILFNNGKFSVAIGTWLDTKNVLAMRWNGEENSVNDVGYPKSFGNPVWFIIDSELKQPIIQALISQNKDVLEKILTKEI